MRSETVPTAAKAGKACLEQLIFAARAAVEWAGGQAGGIGVSVPGLVRRDGTVWAPNIRGWERMPVARVLSDRLKLPVAVESDRNAAVLGEAWLGAARGAGDAIYLIVGTGIGAGILSGGRLVRGAHELSGCAGWMTVEERGAHLEDVAAGPAIAAAGAMMMHRDDVTARDVFAAARRGNRGARLVISEAGRFLGFAVADLISLFDPEIIVLGGGIGEAGGTLLRTVQQTARRWAQPLAARQVRIVASRLRGRAPLLGAARLALDLTDHGWTRKMP